MTTEARFGEYFGFTEPEVDLLYERYRESVSEPGIRRAELRDWYDGYDTPSGERVYNPRSVVAALSNQNLGNYWTSSGPYDEIFYYIEKNVDDVRDDLARMAAGIPVRASIREYAATSMTLRTRDEIFSAMTVYGFLSYRNGFVSIPNRELMNQFDDMLRREPSLGYVNRLAKESERMLGATLSGDTEIMQETIILELKVDHSPDEAIAQIRERKYDLCFMGKAGEKPVYTGRILAVGISYDRKKKRHACKVEVLRHGIT